MKFKETLENWIDFPSLYSILSRDPKLKPKVYPTSCPEDTKNRLKYVPPLYCARYAANIAEEVYNKKITRGNAWDMWKLSGNYLKWTESDPENPYQILEEGDIAICYNEKSRFNQEGRQGTHAIVYVGKDKKGNPTFWHKYIYWTRAINPKGLQKKRLRIVQILSPLHPEKQEKEEYQKII